MNNDSYNYKRDEQFFRIILIVIVALAAILLVGSFTQNLSRAIRDKQEGGISIPTEATTLRELVTETTTETTTEITTTQPSTTTETTTETTTTAQTTTEATTELTTKKTVTTTTSATTKLEKTQLAVREDIPEIYRTLNPKGGIAYGPSGKETYYNLNMDGIIKIMEKYGYTKDDHDVSDQGVHMLGDYIMVAADLSKHPRGSIIPTTLGQAIVCDTGAFVTNGSDVEVDVAVTW